MHTISDSTRRASTFRGKEGRGRFVCPCSQNVGRCGKRPRSLCWSYVIAIIDEMFVERAWKFSNWNIYIYISQEDKSRYFRIPSGSSFFNLENVSSLNAVDKYLTFFFFPNYDGIYIKIISSRSRVTNKFSSSRHRNPRFYFFFLLHSSKTLTFFKYSRESSCSFSSSHLGFFFSPLFSQISLLLDDPSLII